MNEQHEEVNRVEICNRRVETSGKRPRQGHQPITEVIGMPRPSPPTGGEEFSSPLRVHESEILGVSPIPEVVLLPVRAPEDPITGEGDHNYDCSSNASEFDVLKARYRAWRE